MGAARDPEKPAMIMTLLYTYTSAANGVESRVWQAEAGWYSATMRDTDADEHVGTVRTDDVEQAIETAKQWVGLAPAGPISAPLF